MPQTGAQANRGSGGEAMGLPAGALVALIGASGAGKTSFARRHFPATAVLSSDAFRAMVADDENNQAASADAFELLHLALRRRLARGRMTVVDATNVRARARRPLLELARELGAPAAAIVFDLPEALCQARNLRRGRVVGSEVIHRQSEALRRSLPGLAAEGFDKITIFTSANEVNHARLALTNSSEFNTKGRPAQS